jgi:predicted transcriptional regulator
MKHRSETETIALILEAIKSNSRATQTRIMFEAYLSYS